MDNPIARRSNDAVKGGERKEKAARSNLKNLLHGDKNEDIRKPSVNSKSSLGSPKKRDLSGKAGWLYRMNENYKSRRIN